jgi:hypothetical protein
MRCAVRCRVLDVTLIILFTYAAPQTKGYWASYNSPYFKEISVVAGVWAKCVLDAGYCHPSTPRAKIFREHQHNLRNVADVQTMMQYNRYMSDPTSRLDACKAIACRKDLEFSAARRAPFGAIDAKVCWRLKFTRLRSSTSLVSTATPLYPIASCCDQLVTL